MRITILIFIASFFINCVGQKSERCEKEYFEKTSEISFPQNMQVLNCEEDLEGEVWMISKIENKDANNLIKKHNFIQYSSIPTYSEEDYEKILPDYKNDSSIKEFARIMGKDYIEIQKNRCTYFLYSNKQNHSITYIINIDDKLFWTYINYPSRF